MNSGCSDALAIGKVTTSTWILLPGKRERCRSVELGRCRRLSKGGGRVGGPLLSRWGSEKTAASRAFGERGAAHLRGRCERFGVWTMGAGEDSVRGRFKEKYDATISTCKSGGISHVGGTCTRSGGRASREGRSFERQRNVEAGARACGAGLALVATGGEKIGRGRGRQKVVPGRATSATQMRRSPCFVSMSGDTALDSRNRGTPWARGI
jgi:hypothetical protein